MLKYGIMAKAVEWLCFKPALCKLETLRPEMNRRTYRKKVKREYQAMLLRTKTLANGDECCNFHVTRIQ